MGRRDTTTSEPSEPYEAPAAQDLDPAMRLETANAVVNSNPPG